jgi:hypothetical protein
MSFLKKIIFLFFIVSSLSSIAQQRFSEGSLVFNIVSIANGLQSKGDAKMIQFIRGGHYRSEIISSLGRTITIYDDKEGLGAILKEYGQQRIMTPMNHAQWDSKNRKKGTVVFLVTSERKQILGYSCQKATASLPDGSTLDVYFADQLIPENANMELQFEQLQGVVLEYKSTLGNSIVNYVAESLNFDPVPIQNFELPNSGYRILNFEESVKAKN